MNFLFTVSITILTFGITVPVFQPVFKVVMSRDDELDIFPFTYLTDVFYFINASMFQGEITSRYRRSESESYCQIPPNPLHGEYSIAGNDSHSYKEGDYVEQYSVLSTLCDRTFKPLGSNNSICSYGSWNPTPSTCSRTCKTLTSSQTTKVKCMLNRRPLDTCDFPVERTVAYFSCETYYEDPSLNFNPSRACRGGDWEGIPQCFATCGQKRPVGKTNIINGVSATKGDYPWHAGIYNATMKDYLCGGSIISERIIISAAHCLSDARDGTPYPKENYLVAVGKYYRLFHDQRDSEPQYPTIESIHIPEKYKGHQLQYESDIAVIVLRNNLILSETVQPVCVDWQNNLMHEQLIPGNNGIVTGWGYTREGHDLSDELKELIVPFVSHHECYSAVPQSFKKFVRNDKICGGYINNSASTCSGDSGGGLVFQSNERYYLQGIVSTSPSTHSGLCDSNQYGLFTSLHSHIEFVENLYVNNKPLQTPNPETDLQKATSGTRKIVRKSQAACRYYRSQRKFYDDDVHEHLKQFPHMASIEFDSDDGTIDEAFCRGALISKKYVLTSASCVKDRTKMKNVVRIAVIDLYDKRIYGHQKIAIRTTTVHEKYNPTTHIHNIALIELDNEVNITESVLPACLYQEDDDPQNLIVTRYPLLVESGERSSISYIIRKADVHSVSDCVQPFTNEPVKSTEICGVLNDGQSDDILLKDGAPFQTKATSNSLNAIVGVASHEGIIMKSVPLVFTRVSSYIDWIENIVWP